MTINQYQFQISTAGRGMIDVTTQIADCVSQAKVSVGLCNIFLRHTSASLIICENADPDVQQDLEKFMFELVPDGYSLFNHVAEGPDDMPSHVRTVLTTSSLTIPITDYQLALGTWQGIYIWEHRIKEHQRKLIVTIQD